MPGLGPAVVVAPPPATAPAHNLVTSALPQPSGEGDRWQMGFESCPEGCVTIASWYPGCPVTGGPPGAGLKSDATPPPDVVPYTPFMLETPVECCSYGFKSQDYEGRARRQLEAGTPKGLEREFWTGELVPDNPHLASSGAVVVPGGPFDPIKALARLNQAIADCSLGGRGMIHATPYLVSIWVHQFGALDEEGPRLVTKVMKNVVVAGTGYPGTGPTGQAAGGTQWAYATGMVQVRLGDVVVIPDTMAEALDRLSNTVNYRAERVAAASWDTCCHFAVEVSV
jgi:hypothetical protein